jgi:hypothetical protein
LDVEMKVGIFVAQGESLPATALLLFLSYKLQTLAGRPGRLLHSGIRRIFAAAEKPNLYTGPTRRIFGSLDTCRQENVLPEASLGQRERELQFTGVPGKGLWRLRLGDVAGIRRCKQGSDTRGTRRNEKRATIHELFLAEGTFSVTSIYQISEPRHC